MSKRVFRRTVILAATLAFTGFCQSAYATAVPCATGPSPSNVMSCATGVSVDLSILNIVNLAVGPVANVFGTAPAPYNLSTTVASADASGSLVLGSLGLNTGVITDSASSPYNNTLATLFSTATSTVNSLNLGLSLPIVGSLLSVKADTLTSTSRASNTTGTVISTLGTSEIENLVISGKGFSTVTVNAHALASTSINDYLVNLAGLAVISNYQTPIYFDGVDKIGIQTAALAIKFDNFALGTGLLNGTILIADSAASVPEPGAWLMMIVGFGVVGAVARQRQVPALA